MRVLHLYAGNLYGGIERLLVTLARERGHCAQMEPHFGLCFEGRVADELRAAGVPVHPLGGRAVRFSRPWTIWQARRRLGNLLKSQRYDAAICHACWPHAVFAPPVRAAGVPLAFWAHDATDGTHWLERRAAHTPPDLVIANSRFTESAVPKVFPGVRTELAYYPVSTPHLPDRAQLRREVRRELGTPEDAVVVLMASRLERWKGHDVLLQALGRLGDVAGWQCWLAGGAQRPHEAQYLEELQARAAREGIAGRVNFLGQRSDVPRLLWAADFHCQPNTGGEPFGIALVEALAAGLPVVTTRLGAPPEIVTGACGVLVPPDDAPALAAALRGLVGDAERRNALGAAGPARARELCDPSVRLPMLYDLLASAATTAGVAA